MKKSEKYIILVGAIVLLSIGFAVLTGNLIVGGTIFFKNDTYNVYFDNIREVTGSVAVDTENGEKRATIVEDNHEVASQVEFAISLPNLGDYYEFLVDTINDQNGNLMIDRIEKKAFNQEKEEVAIPRYVDFSIRYSDGSLVEVGDYLKGEATETLRVRIEYRENISVADLPSTDSSNTYQISLHYVQATSIAKERIVNQQPRMVTQSVEDEINIGDEISIDTEHFYVLSTNAQQTTLLAKYNLNVGENQNNNVTELLQDESIVGQTSLEGQTTYGTVAFSTNAYWSNGSSLKEEYGENASSSNLNDRNYIRPSGMGYSINFYIEKYEEEINRIVPYPITVRIPTIADITGAGNQEFLTSTNYWIASTSSSISNVRASNDSSTGYTYTNSTRNGVRPVIVIATNLLTE